MLDAMRQRGDEPADCAVLAFTESDGESLRHLLDKLVQNDDVPSAELPEKIATYLNDDVEVPGSDQEMVIAGERVFADYGPEILMLLACYALPAAYAAAKGVQVLYQTSYLAHRPNRRLFETTQMVLDVMTPGGLGVRGRGRRTAQKVRLMHALIRAEILRHPHRPWPRGELGVPINQEDLAGTLMTFSVLVLDGLAKLQIPLSTERAEAYLRAWCVVGRMMGVVDELIPSNLNEARALMATIQRRQIAPSPEGRLMTRTLLDLLEGRSAPGFKRFPAALMRHFLPADVADGLGIPSHLGTALLIGRAVEVARRLDQVAGGPKRRKLFRRFAVSLIDGLVTLELGGKRTKFRIPSGLYESWVN